MQHLTTLFVISSLAAISITTAMDANGLFLFSALPLIILIPFFGYLGALNRKELGFKISSGSHYYFAFLVPLTALVGLALLSILVVDVDLTMIDWRSALSNIAIMASTGILMVAITEEGFFRGLLWACLSKAGHGAKLTLFLTTLVFVVWHLSAVLLTDEFSPPAAQLPIYLLNATLLGLIWGLMRLLSDSIWPPAIYHSIWNALAYVLFGFGTANGALELTNTWLWGPEVGLAGILINGAVAFILWQAMKRENPEELPAGIHSQ